MSQPQRPALFLDKNGIIIQKRPDNHGAMSVKEVGLIRDIIPVFRYADRLGIPVIVVSNQTHFAEGRIDLLTEAALEARFQEVLRENNLTTLGIYHCYHSPVAIVEERRINCQCRKPNPGMLLEAAQTHGLDLTRSWIVGDRTTDILAGQAAGTKTIFYEDGSGQLQEVQKLEIPPTFIVSDLRGISHRRLLEA